MNSSGSPSSIQEWVEIKEGKYNLLKMCQEMVDNCTYMQCVRCLQMF